jgi:tRNA (guanosine-2'-O-)-methyltransferase
MSETTEKSTVESTEESVEEKYSLGPSFKTGTRTAKIDRAISLRQPTLAVVVENIHDPHNFNAILRSCDAVGAMRLCMVYTIEKAPKLAHTSSSGAYKWIDIERYTSVEACFAKLHADGFQILATKLEPSAKQLYDFDMTRPTAIVMGNEHRGISTDAQQLADELLYIPMMGMSESVNVSVATAVCLFEAMRQRIASGMYEAPQLSEEALRSKRLDWLNR